LLLLNELVVTIEMIGCVWMGVESGVRVGAGARVSAGFGMIVQVEGVGEDIFGGEDGRTCKERG
jgi:hypothetical protein